MLSAIDCTIERRLLVNYRIEPDFVASQLPPPFRPQLVGGWAVGGVCFLRLRNLRPAGLPARTGFSSENVAHRFAVEWDGEEGRHAGVYVPRRDTASRLASWSGGYVFPGRYHPAHFDVSERGTDLRIDVTSRDRAVRLSVVARESEVLEGNLFGSLHEATEFFRRGALGYSPAGTSSGLDGARLLSERWDATPVSVMEMRSSLFDNVSLFPPGSCTLDSGLLMRDLPVRWATEARRLQGSSVAVG